MDREMSGECARVRAYIRFNNYQKVPRLVEIAQVYFYFYFIMLAFFSQDDAQYEKSASYIKK